ncbi:DgyrCDS6502 [Dimorphilus gyrociliatus]|uniref:DgyrCDS6502 n=1 Tax=Dimorphilus gyrociliatus TaxID=2664684 RepID=A0A7I8VPT3_9ANNE|nr:DgyrCDS6502 [Dimorphilus gyrociliatus]
MIKVEKNYTPFRQFDTYDVVDFEEQSTFNGESSQRNLRCSCSCQETEKSSYQSNSLGRRIPRSSTFSHHISNNSLMFRMAKSNAMPTSSSSFDQLPTRRYSFHNAQRESTPAYLVVADSMLAIDATLELSQEEKVSYTRDWCVVEKNCAFNLERPLEDHENLCKVRSSWSKSENNKFLFKKDPRRYALFQQGVTYFPDSMLDMRFTVGHAQPTANFSDLAEAEKTKVSQSLLNAAPNMPDIQGYLYFKNGRSKWKKYFFVLRPSGLYYSMKSNSKEPRHLVLVNLSEYEIHMANNAKKTLDSHNDYCLVLKKRSDNDIGQWLQLCAEEESSRQKWHMALRLVKYGKQLNDDYEAAVVREGKIQSKPSYGRANTDMVAMDFTGSSGGRVIDDPFEAFGVAIEEAAAWRRRGRVNMPRSSPSYSSRSPLTSPASLMPPSNAHMASNLHLTQSWFYHNITREDAESLLLSNGAGIDGFFLIRESMSIPDVHVISFVFKGQVKHCKIHLVSRMKLYFNPAFG